MPAKKEYVRYLNSTDNSDFLLPLLYRFFFVIIIFMNTERIYYTDILKNSTFFSYLLYVYLPLKVGEDRFVVVISLFQLTLISTNVPKTSVIIGIGFEGLSLC
ncbi:MAG: hypothetical protein LBI26_00885 [Holosporales bacterium]|jgi:hypothetical protein|nr:hypothetical protein [Holosporales bacterium]